jgi:hypothetical protein
MSILKVAQTPAITAGAYDAADAVGGKLTFAGAASVYRGAGEIVRVTIIDDANQKAQLKLWLYDQTFTASADNAACDPTDADNQNCLGCINIAAADYMTATDNSVSSTTVSFPFKLVAGGTSLFGQLQCVATPTYAAVDDLTVILTIEK